MSFSFSSSRTPSPPLLQPSSAPQPAAAGDSSPLVPVVQEADIIRTSIFDMDVASPSVARSKQQPSQALAARLPLRPVNVPNSSSRNDSTAAHHAMPAAAATMDAMGIAGDSAMNRTQRTTPRSSSTGQQATPSMAHTQQQQAHPPHTTAAATQPTQQLQQQLPRPSPRPHAAQRPMHWGAPAPAEPVLKKTDNNDNPSNNKRNVTPPNTAPSTGGGGSKGGRHLPDIKHNAKQILCAKVVVLLQDTMVYSLIPPSGKVVVFDSELEVRHAFKGLDEHNVNCAPVWEYRRCQYVGMFTVSDFVDIVDHHVNLLIAASQEHQRQQAAAAAAAAATVPSSSTSQQLQQQQQNQRSSRSRNSSSITEQKQQQAPSASWDDQAVPPKSPPPPQAGMNSPRQDKRHRRRPEAAAARLNDINSNNRNPSSRSDTATTVSPLRGVAASPAPTELPALPAALLDQSRAFYTQRFCDWQAIKMKRGTSRPRLVCVQPEASLFDAVHLLVSHRVHRLAVMHNIALFNTVLCTLSHIQIARWLVQVAGAPPVARRASVMPAIDTKRDAAAAAAVDQLSLKSGRADTADATKVGGGANASAAEQKQPTTVVPRSQYVEELHTIQLGDLSNVILDESKCPTVDLDTSVSSLISVYVKSRLPAIPIVDPENRLVWGTISRRELRAFARLEPSVETLASVRIEEVLKASRTLGTLGTSGKIQVEREGSPMGTTGPAQYASNPLLTGHEHYCCSRNDSLYVVLRKFAMNNCHMLVVVHDDRQLAGIVELRSFFAFVVGREYRSSVGFDIAGTMRNFSPLSGNVILGAGGMMRGAGGALMMGTDQSVTSLVRHLPVLPSKVDVTHPNEPAMSINMATFSPAAPSPKLFPSQQPYHRGAGGQMGMALGPARSMRLPPAPMLFSNERLTPQQSGGDRRGGGADMQRRSTTNASHGGASHQPWDSQQAKGVRMQQQQPSAAEERETPPLRSLLTQRPQESETGVQKPAAMPTVVVDMNGVINLDDADDHAEHIAGGALASVLSIHQSSPEKPGSSKR